MRMADFLILEASESEVHLKCLGLTLGTLQMWVCLFIVLPRLVCRCRSLAFELR